MATTQDFVEYVCSQVAEAGEVRFRKMFGEYMVYVNDRPVLLVCDNMVFVKPLDCVEALLGNCDKGLPYEGASREHYILDIDDAALSTQVAKILAEHLPLPKPRSKKKKLEQ